MQPPATPPFSVDDYRRIGTDCLPGTLGIVIDGVEDGRVEAHLPIQPRLANPYGIPHGGTVVALADTCCGYASIHHMPAHAKAFTTIELKTNFLGTATEGTLRCVTTPVHLGRTTQVWDAVVTHAESGKAIAMFRCTQMLLAR
jgi:1,4-dihydroxy-2-naphthoyl-CoA hydrolase